MMWKAKIYKIMMIAYKKTDEWYIEWHRMTTSATTHDNEWHRVVQRTTTSCASDNEWQRVTKNDNEWQQW